jgi:heat induced stress protein YflT
MIVTIVRLYDHHSDAANAVHELRKAGVPERDISILSRDDRVHGAATGAEIGAAVGGLAGLLTGLGLIAIPGIGPVAAAGWLAATVAGAAAGGWVGGALGLLSEAGISGEEAHAIAECLRRGATVVTAQVPEADKDRYAAILDRGAIDVRLRVAAYRQTGWTSYDPNAAPYTAEEIARERERNRG